MSSADLRDVGEPVRGTSTRVGGTARLASARRGSAQSRAAPCRVARARARRASPRPRCADTARACRARRGSVSVMRGSPAPGARIGSTRARPSRQRLGQWSPPGKNEAVWPSSPMPSTTDVERQRQRRDARVGLGQAALRASAPPRDRAARTAPPPAASLQQVVAHQPRVGAVGRSRRHPALVDQRHRRPWPSRAAARDSACEEIRRRACRRRPRSAARSHARARSPPRRLSPATVLRRSARSGQLVAGRAKSCTSGESRRVRHHSLSSCQVRPSRSISATAALGPQVPAV